MAKVSAVQMPPEEGKRVAIFLNEECIASGGMTEYPHGHCGTMRACTSNPKERLTSDGGTCVRVWYDKPFTKGRGRERHVVHYDYLPRALLRDPSAEQIAEYTALEAEQSARKAEIEAAKNSD